MFCNGLMDHLCVCERQFKGMVQSTWSFLRHFGKKYLIKLLCEYSFSLPVMFFKYKYH